jgi:hypothetical protein
MNEVPLVLSVRSPLEILAMKYPEEDKYLPSGIFAKGQPFALVGPAAVGKSRLLLQLIVCLISGRPFLGWSMKKHKLKVLIVQTENGGRRLQADFLSMRAWIGEKAFAEVDSLVRMHTLETEHDTFLSLDDDTNSFLINEAIAKHKPDIVVFDPLIAFSVGNLNTDTAMLKTCRGLQRLATMHNPDATVVVLHHSLAGKAGIKKAVGFDAGAYARGSKAFVQWLRGQLNVAPAKEGDTKRLVVGCGKNSNGPWFEPFGIMLNPATMVYEVDQEFDLAEWLASMGMKSTIDPEPKLNSVTVAALAGPIPVSKKTLADAIMTEYAVAKTRAYDAIKQAVAAQTIVRNTRKLYAAA